MMFSDFVGLVIPTWVGRNDWCSYCTESDVFRHSGSCFLISPSDISFLHIKATILLLLLTLTNKTFASAGSHWTIGISPACGVSKHLLNSQTTSWVGAHREAFMLLWTSLDCQKWGCLEAVCAGPDWDGGVFTVEEAYRPNWHGQWWSICTFRWEPIWQGHSLMAAHIVSICGRQTASTHTALQLMKPSDQLTQLLPPFRWL